jgi:hypothetical protein
VETANVISEGVLSVSSFKTGRWDGLVESSDRVCGSMGLLKLLRWFGRRHCILDVDRELVGERGVGEAGSEEPVAGIDKRRADSVCLADRGDLSVDSGVAAGVAAGVKCRNTSAIDALSCSRMNSRAPGRRSQA